MIVVVVPERASDWRSTLIQNRGMKVVMPMDKVERRKVTAVSFPKPFQSSFCPAAIAALVAWAPSLAKPASVLVWLSRKAAMRKAGTARIAVPFRPKWEMPNTASMGPTAPPRLPPTEKLLMPRPLRSPAT